MTFNTGNPIGSTDARDLSDNAENFDKALGTLDATWTDRLGVTRDSFEGRLAKGSFYRVGDFATGYTLTNMRQTLEYSGHEYSWAGTFPKVVAAGSTPATSGGVGAGAWVDRTDVTLRSEINIVVKRFASVADMVADTSLQIGQLVVTNGYYNGIDGGANTYKIVSSGTATEDGGSYITLGNGLQANGIFIDGVDVRAFGAKSDAYISKPTTIAGMMGWSAIRNPSATDSRAAIENAINYASSIGGATIVFDGDFYVNSYSADTALVSAHSQILPVKSNITYQGVNNSHIVVGQFFDDKSFVLFSGFNSPVPADFTKIFNVAFKGLSFDFHGESSWMRTAYKRRLGIDFGWAFNTEVSWCNFENGDLSNAIGIAAGTRQPETCTIDNCNFFNLVQENPVNIDFTANYIGARNSTVTNCRYSNASIQGARVACAVEFHAPLCKFSDSTIHGGYTRGFWVTAHAKETTLVHDCGADNITSYTTNAFCWLWAEAGCLIESVAVRNCTIKCHHIVGDILLYNAYQGLVACSGDGTTGAIYNFHATNNVVWIMYTEAAAASWNLKRDSAVFMESPYDYDNLNISFNTFINTMGGVTIRTPEHSINNVTLANNEFRIYDGKVLVADQTLIELTCASMLSVMVHSNTFNVSGAQSVSMNELAIINTGGMTDCYIETNSRIVGHRPIRGDIYQQPAMFNNLVRSTIKCNKYNVILAIPDIPASSFGVAEIDIHEDFTTDGNCHFEFIPNTYIGTEYVSSFSGNRIGVGRLGCTVYNRSLATKPGSNLSGVTAIKIVRS